MMPAFGRDGILKNDEIADVVGFVRSLTNLPTPRADLARGKTLFAANCAVCHGNEGKGNREFGAPNLTDAIWLYGSSIEAVTESVTNARGGVMPAWSGRLDDVTLKALAVYVHTLGGGER